jgi:hypothetical protein
MDNVSGGEGLLLSLSVVRKAEEKAVKRKFSCLDRKIRKLSGGFQISKYGSPVCIVGFVGPDCSELLVTSSRIQRFPAKAEIKCLSQSRTTMNACGTVLEIQGSNPIRSMFLIVKHLAFNSRYLPAVAIASLVFFKLQIIRI